MVGGFLLGPVDPHLAGDRLGDGPAADEALRMQVPRAVEGAPRVMAEPEAEAEDLLEEAEE